MNGFTQMLGPLIAYGTTFYQGSSFDNQPWRLLYIVFGVFTVVVGVLVYFFMPSNPQHARFLNEREKRIALERVRDNAAGTAQRTFKWSQVREASLELRIWLVFLFVVLTSIPNGGLSSFQSKILKGFGYSSRETLLLQLPSGFISGMTTLLCSWLSDRYQERMLPIVSVGPVHCAFLRMDCTEHCRRHLPDGWAPSHRRCGSHPRRLRRKRVDTQGSVCVCNLYQRHLWHCLVDSLRLERNQHRRLLQESGRVCRQHVFVCRGQHRWLLHLPRSRVRGCESGR